MGKNEMSHKYFHTWLITGLNTHGINDQNTIGCIALFMENIKWVTANISHSLF